LHDYFFSTSEIRSCQQHRYHPMGYTNIKKMVPVPPDVLVSALRLVASLTSVLARVLGIALPHPIILNAELNELENTCDAAEVDCVFTKMARCTQEKQTIGAHTLKQKSPILEDVSISRPTAGIRERHFPSPWRIGSSIGGTTTKMAAAAISGVGNAVVGGVNILKKSAPSVQFPYTYETNVEDRVKQRNSSNIDRFAVSGDAKNANHISPSLRIKHATSAIIKEERSKHPMSLLSDDTIATFDLRPPSLNKSSDDSGCSFENEEDLHTFHEDNKSCKNGLNNVNDAEVFHIGLQLLQNNIVSLCIHVGVPIDTLYPAEAVLLNLESLKYFCLEVTKK